MNKDPVVIVAMARTPMGGFGGDFSAVAAPELGSSAIKAAVERSGVDSNDIDEVYMGCVLPAGLGQAPARQAALGAGLPLSTGCTTINKVCGSGMKTVMIAHDSLLSGNNTVMVAGGMESMSNVPYLLEKHRSGQRIGHGAVKDSMFLDGLEDAYDKGRLMGTFAQQTADDYEFTREQQDDYAIESTKRAQAAIANGNFEDEISPVTIKSRKGEVIVSIDEQPGKARIDKIPTLRPAFAKDGTVTAANSSSISDGAAAMVLMRQSEADNRGLSPLARIVAHASNAQKPEEFTIAPVGAVKKLFEKTGWNKDDVDLFEVNEAFAIVTMAAIKDLDLDHEIVNVHGGACSLGHPLGVSGARILITLIAALKQRDLKRGVATLCIGGGEATAMAVEII
ncbi:MAG: acetyl-CoA C-acyltransferase [Gammaproteobacteria bacterium]|nr:acetyl-CoA C-acyltransferase [Gammaproteobacteria bacterium]